MENQEGNKPSQETRKFPRLSTDIDVVYARTGTDSQVSANTVKDISAGGICLIAYEDIPIGTILSLKIDLPETNGPVDIKGKVVWKNKFTIDTLSQARYDVGVQFVDIPQEYQEAIMKHVFVSPKKRTLPPANSP